ncbi:post-mRNA release spliceosomal complex protein [Malassezia pachydermatis]|uniref:Cwf18 pre-mrna splicing factor n=1 Tax=Malassezia pachydermatis TaxID=77020 RepID=A0A0N0RSN1_9BASI|nr:hypothetical protein Malapachy_3302 [Malassezia pachydermatis]KOS15995.1 hypothetical protein Malapachy_3302 [Malassezia pachydermatis]
MSMEAAAAVRKARIHALRSLREAEEAGDQAAIAANAFGAVVKQSFRQSEPPASLVSTHKPPETVEKEVDGLQERVIENDRAKQAEDLDLMNIAPRKPNWDLRRDLEQRLQQLDARTKAAIHTLIGTYILSSHT